MQQLLGRAEDEGGEDDEDEDVSAVFVAVVVQQCSASEQDVSL